MTRLAREIPTDPAHPIRKICIHNKTQAAYRNNEEQKKTKLPPLKYDIPINMF